MRSKDILRDGGMAFVTIIAEGPRHGGGVCSHVSELARPIDAAPRRVP